MGKRASEEQRRGDAPVAVHLHLLEDARSELMPHEAHSSSVASLTSHDVLFAARARACRRGSTSQVSRHFWRAHIGSHLPSHRSQIAFRRIWNC